MRIFEDYDEDFVDFDFDLGEFGDFFLRIVRIMMRIERMMKRRG